MDVTCADVDDRKIDGLKRNVLPIYEPGLVDVADLEIVSRAAVVRRDLTVGFILDRKSVV